MKSLRPAAALLAVMLTACTADAADLPVATGSPTTATSPTPTPSPTPSPTATPPGTVTGLGPVELLPDDDLAAMAVNEIGRVLVSEWHEIGADTDGDYQNTTATFRDQLQELYDRGYRPVTTREYRAGTLPIPAGTRPVVLSFDDSSPNHFRWADDGVTPDPDSVVGILEDFAATHDAWRPTAVFAYNWTPFGTTDEADVAAKLTWLVEHGYELSNHTLDVDLGDLSDQEVQDQLGGNVANLVELVPDATIDTLALPYGIHPSNRVLEQSGRSSDGRTYDHALVFEVGWMPDSSPHHVDYDPTSIMRVPAHGPWTDDDLDWWDWLDWLDEDSHAFVSDGDPDTVTFPTGFVEVADVAADVPTRTYDRPPLGAASEN